MSKFWFFDRKGRPTTNEKRICDTFNSLIDDAKYFFECAGELFQDGSRGSIINYKRYFIGLSKKSLS